MFISADFTSTHLITRLLSRSSFTNLAFMKLFGFAVHSFFSFFFFLSLKEANSKKKKKKSTKLSVEAFPKSLFRVSYRICWLFALTENKKSKIENLCQVIFNLNLYPFITTPCVYIQRIPALTL